MIGIFNSIKIGSADVFRPSDFTPVKEEVYAAEYTTCTGATIADRVGWKYADMTLSWDTLPADQLSSINVHGVTTLTFDTPEGTVTEDVRIMNKSTTATRFEIVRGVAVWKDISLGVSFLNVHN